MTQCTPSACNAAGFIYITKPLEALAQGWVTCKVLSFVRHRHQILSKARFSKCPPCHSARPHAPQTLLSLIFPPSRVVTLPTCRGFPSASLHSTLWVVPGACRAKVPPDAPGPVDPVPYSPSLPAGISAHPWVCGLQGVGVPPAMETGLGSSGGPDEGWGSEQA